MKHRTFHDLFHELIASIDTSPNTRKMWLRTVIASTFALVVATLYIAAAGGWDGIVTLNRAFAQVGFLFIGISMMMSSVCYFWDFADHMIICRKHAGLVGFWHIVIHGIISLALKKFDITFFLLPENITAFVAAVVATIILVMMALISNRFAVHELGGKNWRRLLRLGYVVIIFGMIHMDIKVWPQWELWITNPNTLPPLSILMTVFLFIVIALRVLLWYHLAQKKRIA